MAVANPDQAAREALVHGLIAEHPEARLFALSETGVSAAVPDDLPRPARGLVGRGVRDWNLRFVVPEDQLAAVDAWARALTDGTAQARLRLLDDPESAVEVHFVDWRHRSEVILLVVTGCSVLPTRTARDEVANPRLLPRAGLTRKDQLGQILEADEATAQMLRFASPGELCGRRSLELMHPDDRQIAIAHWMEMLAVPGSYRRCRVRHRTGDGGWLWVELTNHNLLDDDAHRCVVSEIVDISSEVRATEALRDKDRLLHRITEALPVGIAHVDPSLQIAYRNSRLSALLGYRTQDRLADQLAGVRAEDRTTLMAAVEAILAQGGDTEVEIQVPLGGETRHCQVTVCGLAADDGALTGAIVCVHDVTDSVLLRARLERRATRDGLTGCLNRSAVMLRAQRLLAAAEPGNGVALIYLDLDDFKQVNDRYGHACGDDVLRQVGASLRTSALDPDLVGRLGGDEFLIVCPDAPSRAHAISAARRFESAITPIDVEAAGHRFVLSATIGLAWSAGGETAEAVIARADAVMYDRKRAGGRSATGA